MMTEPKKWEGAVEIPVDQIEPDPLNANVMSPGKFGELVATIQEQGFDEPLQVAELPDEKLPDGRQKYVIIGGEHRHRAAKVLTMPTVPCVIKPIADVTKRRLEMVRRNLIRGDLDRVKFNTLVQDLARRKTMTAEQMAKGMGFSNEKEFGKYFREEKKEADAKVQEMMNQSRKEIVLTDNLAYVLSELFSKFGATMPEGWLLFAYKNQLHMMLQMEPELNKAVQVLGVWARRDKKMLQDVLNSAIRSELTKWGVDVEAFDLPGEGEKAENLPEERLPKDEVPPEDRPAEEPAPVAEVQS